MDYEAMKERSQKNCMPSAEFLNRVDGYCLPPAGRGAYEIVS